GYVEVLRHSILIKYEPFEEIGYTETAPTRMLMMAPMNLDEFEDIDNSEDDAEAENTENTQATQGVYGVGSDTEKH
ncbi:MAG: hypothetical protein J5622_04000, partial [Firmicutes bacterium]|nr:hypothetical protein [Bacillota bacterium]